MSIILAIDPGIRGVGAALFVNSWLEACAYVANPSTKGNGPLECLTMAKAVNKWCQLMGHLVIDELVVEWPQVYKVSKGDPNDLLALAGVDAALAVEFYQGPYFKMTHYKPREWKGTAPKEVFAKRILSRLTPDELLLIPSGYLAHNAIDAVGTGLYKLGKLEPKRVFAK